MTRTIAMSWLIAALLSSIMGVLQYFDAVNGALATWVQRPEVGNAFANLRQRNQFASLTSIGLASLLWLVPHWRSALAGRLLVASGILLLAAGNAASGSRTGALQWLMLAGLALVWDRQENRAMLRWTMLALGLYVAANVFLPLLLELKIGQVPPSALDRITETGSGESRLVLWSNVLSLIAEKPWLGWGWGELKFAHFTYPYQGARFGEMLDNAHNLPLHLAVELGMPAALLLCAVPVIAAIKLQPWKTAEPSRQLGWSVLLLLALHSLLEYPLWYAPFQLSAVLSLGLAGGLQTLAHWQQERFRNLGRTLAASMAAMLLAITAYAAWDYWRISQLYLPPAERLARWREDTYHKVKDSVLFRREVEFAYVTTTTITPDNAAEVYAAAAHTLYFSPEPRVLAVLLESASLAGEEGDFTNHIRHQWRLAYPDSAPPQPSASD
jgi:O-antigen ligase